MKRIVVNAMAEEVRAVVIDEENSIEQLIIERTGQESIVNHIYRGIVRNVLPGMAAAFLDIGREQNAYLNLKQGKQTKAMNKLHVGQAVMVQVVKEEMLGKSARVTADVSLAGRFMVLLPYSEGLRISKKIKDDSTRDMLKRMASPYVDQGCGFIIRTAAAEATELEIKNDMVYLWQTWEQLRKRFAVAKSGSELYRDADIWFRLLRDYATGEVSEIIVDSKMAYQQISERILAMGLTKLEVVLATVKGSIFRHYNLDTQIDNLMSQTVELPSGGSLRFDFTEALTVIDVNSGHFTGQTGEAGETALAVNLEAAKEIARQLRLRNIGGIIICDFIDMPKKEQQDMLLSLLATEVQKDKTKTIVCGITSLGLVELTRKRERQSLQSLLFESCPDCGGTSYVLGAETIYIQIKRKLRELYREGRLSSNIMISVHPDVAKLFTDSICKQLSGELNRTIKVESDMMLNREAYSLLAME